MWTGGAIFAGGAMASDWINIRGLRLSCIIGTEEFERLKPGSKFKFRCFKGAECFTQCCGDVNIVISQKRTHVAATHVADADATHDYTIAWGNRPFSPQRRRWDNVRETTHPQKRSTCFHCELTSCLFLQLRYPFIISVFRVLFQGRLNTNTWLLR